MTTSSRQQLKEYALRALGDPVVEINVDDIQLEDRIDEALEYWRLYHYEGIEQVYLKAKINASKLKISTPTAHLFEVGETITGNASGATCLVTQERTVTSTGDIILVKKVNGTFLNGETITSSTGKTAITASNPMTLGEYDKKYIEMPDHVYGVISIFDMGQASSTKNMFNLQYKLRLYDLYDLASTSLIYYKEVMNHLALINFELNGKNIFRFNRIQNRLYLDVNWEYEIEVGEYVVVSCYRALNPNEFTKVWNEPWLKHYVTALFKKQWAVNIKKFSGIQLPGGIVLDGDKLYEEATSEIKELEDDLQNKSAPLEFFMG